jgi:hypothetical protein
MHRVMPICSCQFPSASSLLLLAVMQLLMALPEMQSDWICIVVLRGLTYIHDVPPAVLDMHRGFIVGCSL